jgi:LTXXQ motif family protein
LEPPRREAIIASREISVAAKRGHGGRASNNGRLLSAVTFNVKHSLRESRAAAGTCSRHARFLLSKTGFEGCVMNPNIKSVAFALVAAAALSSTSFAAGQRPGGHGGGGHGGGGHFARGGGGGHAHFGGGFHGGGFHMGGHGGGFHVGSGRVGGARSNFAAHPSSRPAPAFETQNRAANFSHAAAPATLNGAGASDRRSSERTEAVRGALRSNAVAGALHNPDRLRDPNLRNHIAANAATAGLMNRRGQGRGWWRHADGGYGWVGPVFWPFAYDDMYDYALWGGNYDGSLWDYNYGDIYAGLFAPYGYDALAGYFPQAGAAVAATPPAPGASAPSQATEPVAQMCGEEGHDIAGLPLDKVQAAIQPNDEQRTALDALANASTKAAQDIAAACPTSPALTAPGRLEAMEKRLEAIAAATQAIKEPLDRLYGLLSDEQKARLTALGQDQRQQQSAAPDANKDAHTLCSAQPDFTQWPADQIEQKLHPTEAQKMSLGALQEAANKASETLKASCEPGDALTPPARLDAAVSRVDALLQAEKSVDAPLKDFYATLTDEQKAQFESIGPERTAQMTQANEPTGGGRIVYHRHWRGYGGLQGVMRHIFSILR